MARIAPMNGKEIQAAAGQILELFLEGQNPAGHVKLKPYRQQVITAAFKLLSFEKLISMQSEFRITASGRNHIDKHGCVVYPVNEKFEEALEAAK